MEDACLYVDNFSHNNQYLFGVFDGHGGTTRLARTRGSPVRAEAFLHAAVPKRALPEKGVRISTDGNFHGHGREHAIGNWQEGTHKHYQT